MMKAQVAEACSKLSHLQQLKIHREILDVVFVTSVYLCICMCILYYFVLSQKING